jgi:Ca-activated chloride channel homolog
MKLRLTIWVSFILLAMMTYSQRGQDNLLSGNEAYRKGDFEKAIEEYRKSMKKDPQDMRTHYNLGNAFMKGNQATEARKQYAVIGKSKAATGIRSDAFYNEGVSYSKEKQLDASIESYKRALRLDPSNTQARENLMRALREKQQENEQKNKQQKKEKQRDPMDPRQAQQRLQALEQQEQRLRKQMQQQTPTSGQPEKDW